MNPEEQNYKKSLLFKVIIIVIIVAVFFLWLANLRNVFSAQQKSNDKTWEKITKDVDNSLERLDKITSNLVSSSSENNFVSELIDKTSSTATSTLSTTTVKVELRAELSDLIKTATTTLKSDCPEYINCMPTIGEARPCVIPVGCEKITQIAY